MHVQVSRDILHETCTLYRSSFTVSVFRMNLSKSATPSPADYMVTNFHQTDRLSQHQQQQQHHQRQQQQQLMTHHQNNIRCNETVINCRPGSGVSSSLGSSSVHSSPTIHGPSAGPPAAAAVAAAAAAAGGIHPSIFASPSVLAASAGILGHPQWLAPESSAFYSPLVCHYKYQHGL